MVISTTSIRSSDGSIVTIECHDRLESTVRLAREYARNGYPDRYAVVSEYDTEKAEDKRGIFISLILRPSFFPSQAGLLSSLSSVAFVTALEGYTAKRLGIGWVSNVYCEGKAFGGVTIEGKLDSFLAYEYIIVNFSASLSDEDFPPRMTDLIKKVFESNSTTITSIIAQSVLSKFFTLYANMKNTAKFMNVYRKKFVLHGVKIKKIQDGKKTACKVLSVNNSDCSLMVENKDGTVEKIITPASVIIPKSVRLPKKQIKEKSLG